MEIYCNYYFRMLACILFVFGTLIEYACILFNRGFDEDEYESGEEEEEDEEDEEEEEEEEAVKEGGRGAICHENRLFGQEPPPQQQQQQLQQQLQQIPLQQMEMRKLLQARENTCRWGDCLHSVAARCKDAIRSRTFWSRIKKKL